MGNVLFVRVEECGEWEALGIYSANAGVNFQIMFGMDVVSNCITQR